MPILEQKTRRGGIGGDYPAALVGRNLRSPSNRADKTLDGFAVPRPMPWVESPYPMTDEQNPEQPLPDQSRSAEPTGLSEVDLDAALSDAAALASELSHNVGPPDAPDSSPGADLAGDEAIRCEADLDAQLDDMERLLDAAGTAVDVPPSEPEVPPEHSDAGTPAPSNTAADDLTVAQGTPSLPDVLGAESETPSAQSGPTPDAGSAPEPGIVGGRIVNTRPGSLDMRAPVESPPDSAKENTGEVEAAEPAGILLRITSRVSPVASRLCERAVGALELIDKPVARIGPGTRHRLGIAAIAILALALVAYVVSVF